MPADITIQKMLESDIEMVKSLEEESGLSPWTKNDYFSEIDRPDSIALTAKTNKLVIGFLVARLITPKKFKFEFEAEIFNIGVKSPFRKKGIGTLLLEELCGQLNLTKIFLEVRKSNIDAISFYQSNEFKIIGERRRFYANPTEDAVLLCKDLKPG